eukprot:2979868-Amphidinium_carterae.3
MPEAGRKWCGVSIPSVFMLAFQFLYITIAPSVACMEQCLSGQVGSNDSPNVKAMRAQGRVRFCRRVWFKRAHHALYIH